ncbi:tail fiber protein / tail tubular protein A [Enterobacter phage 02_vB_Eclo_IJM]|nr:tail fiber protein / tail tubular protein A [Enterobacter phage 02_vB_Eclo_IJM]
MRVRSTTCSTQSTTFTAAITVELVELKPYSEMPVVFRDYIVTKASRQVQR